MHSSGVHFRRASGLQPSSTSRRAWWSTSWVDRVGFRSILELASRLLDRIGRNSYHISMKSVVGEKGQVTIPKPLRDSLALGPGTEIEFEEDHGKLVGRRLSKRDPLSALVGVL